MSVRVDTTSLIAGAVVVGDRGLGVTGAVIRATTATGTHGPGILYDDWDSAADDTKEFRALVVTPPASGTLYVWEDGSFTLTGAADGTYTLTYRLYVDGVDLGTAVETITIGAGGGDTALVVSAATHGHAAETASLSTELALNVAAAAHAHVAGNLTLNLAGAGDLEVQDATHAHTSGTLALATATWLVIQNAVHAHTGGNVGLFLPGDELTRILQILSNRQELNPNTGKFTIYADDSVTVLYQANAWEDAAGTIPYRGQALRRIDALT